MLGVTQFVADAWGSITGVSAGALVAALVLHVVKMAVEARSWHEIVSYAYPGARVSFRTTFAAFAGSAGASAVLPARAGEALRVGIIRRSVVESNVVTIAATIALETALEVLFGIAIVVAWLTGDGAIGGSRSLIGRFSGPTAHPWVWTGAVVVLIAAGLAGIHSRTRMRQLATRFAEGFSILRSPGTFARRVLTWKVLSWMLRFATVLAFLAAFHIPAALWTALVVVAAQTAAGAVPLLPGNAGTQQATITVGLAGTATAAALIGFGVGMQMATTLIDLAVAAVALALVPPERSCRSCGWWRPNHRSVEPEPSSA